MKAGNKKNKGITPSHLLIPAIITSIATAFLVFILNYLNFDLKYGLGLSALIFASFGSSIFLMFMTPEFPMAKPSKFLRSYIIAAFVGFFFHFFIQFTSVAIISGITIFVMSMLLMLGKSEHGPAVGIALAFVLFDIGIAGIIVVFGGILIIGVFKVLFDKYILWPNGNSYKL